MVPVHYWLVQFSNLPVFFFNSSTLMPAVESHSISHSWVLDIWLQYSKGDPGDMKPIGVFGFDTELTLLAREHNLKELGVSFLLLLVDGS